MRIENGGKHETTLVILVAIVLGAPTLARAQNWGRDSGYTIIKSGEPPTFVNPNFSCGYTAITPGEPPTFINRSFNGGYMLITPGEPPTFINPTIPSAPSTPILGEDGDDDNWALRAVENLRVAVT